MNLRRKRKKYEHALMIGDIAISSEVTQEFFACDIARCKGACCVEGDLGAPLEKEEMEVLDNQYEQIEPYLREEGKAAIREQGKYVYDFTREHSTPLVNGKECAYVTFSDKGIALCGIEQAHMDGKIDLQKPLSCHLYPVRINKNRYIEAINYDRWDICSAACTLGSKSEIRVFEFVKDALIRKYGEEFYTDLEAVVKIMEKRMEEE